MILTMCTYTVLYSKLLYWAIYHLIFFVVDTPTLTL